VGPDPAFDVLVAGERWLGGGRDRVDVVGVAVSRGTMWRCWARRTMLVMSSPAGATGVLDDRVHRVKPFLRLGSVSEVDSMSLRLQAHAPVRY
jgi:hypothetical protein